ncbi:MAG: DUF885 domain-containing protein, partial [Hymenobacter sp.]
PQAISVVGRSIGKFPHARLGGRAGAQGREVGNQLLISRVHGGLQLAFGIGQQLGFLILRQVCQLAQLFLKRRVNNILLGRLGGEGRHLGQHFVKHESGRHHAVLLAHFQPLHHLHKLGRQLAQACIVVLGIALVTNMMRSRHEGRKLVLHPKQLIDRVIIVAKLRPRSTTEAGVWKFPDGAAYYAYCLRLNTTTNLTAKKIHALGLREVARITAEMQTILRAQHEAGADSVGPTMARLGEEPRFLYPDTDAGRARILTDYKQILAEVNQGLAPAFRIRPRAKLDVQRVPEFKQKTSPGAYYNGAALDGSRPGTFYANLYDVKATPKFGMRTLAYHEGIPGHHFQIGIAQELEGLPTFRRVIPFTAYAEGWALYAEQLTWELGFEKDPYDNLGRLRAELFRSVRLVVDTGIHDQRWTREQAIQYMRQTTGIAESDVEAEIERYIVMPGQACAYKAGMLKILELRERAQQQLGSKFDLRDFHDAVLKSGSMPLEVLEQAVNDYIAAKKAAA